MDALFDFYLEHGCPCRFPRFRGTVGRSFKDFAGWEFTTTDVNRLVSCFDRRVHLVETQSEDFATRGRCERCGAEVTRYGIPVYKDAFIERATITPGPMPDVGAGIHSVVPICAPLYRVGPATNTRSSAGGAAGGLPQLNVEDWLEYMRALA